MRVRGHVPNTFVVLLDIEDSENVRFLFWHSGRLAVVFGLMQTWHGTPSKSKVTKNLRVCKDCHAALKMILKIVDKKIVVKGHNWFHCFKNGECSCKKY